MRLSTVRLVLSMLKANAFMHEWLQLRPPLDLAGNEKSFIRTHFYGTPSFVLDIFTQHSSCGWPCQLRLPRYLTSKTSHGNIEAIEHTRALSPPTTTS